LPEEERRKKRRSVFDDIFEEFDELVRRFESEFEEMEEEFEELIRSEGKTPEKPYYYGIRIYVGPDGVPRIEQFGNIKKAGRGKVILSEETELSSCRPAGRRDKDKIKVNAAEKKLYIRAEGDKRKYYKEVDLPVEVDPSTAKASYRNGVLEVRIKKKEGQRPQGVEVKVE